MWAPPLFQVCRKEALWGQEVSCADSQANESNPGNLSLLPWHRGGQAPLPLLRLTQGLGVRSGGRAQSDLETLHPEFLGVQLHRK